MIFFNRIVSENIRKNVRSHFLSLCILLFDEGRKGRVEERGGEDRVSNEGKRRERKEN